MDATLCKYVAYDVTKLYRDRAFSYGVDRLPPGGLIFTRRNDNLRHLWVNNVVCIDLRYFPSVPGLRALLPRLCRPTRIRCLETCNPRVVIPTRDRWTIEHILDYNLHDRNFSSLWSIVYFYPQEWKRSVHTTYLNNFQFFNRSRCTFKGKRAREVVSLRL